MFDEMKTKVSPCESEIKFAVSDILFIHFSTGSDVKTLSFVVG